MKSRLKAETLPFRAKADKERMVHECQAPGVWNRMKRLGFYLFRQLATAFVFAGLAVTFVVLFTQMFRLLSLVIDNSSTLWIFLQLLGLSIPTFLPLVLPLSLGVAVTFVYHKLAIDSELVVMRAAGISPLRLAAPALLLAGIVMIVCYSLTLWLTPAANRELVSLEYKMRDNFAVLLSRPGSFNDITDGLTFFARGRGPNGSLEGILIHDVRKPDQPVTIMAESGQIMDNHGQPQLIIFNGRRQEMHMDTGQLSQLAFEQYVLDLDALRAASPPRLPDPREMSVFGLLHPSAEILKVRGLNTLTAELHQRLASPLLALSYALIGLTAILAGEFNRRGMGKRLLIAALAIVVVQAFNMSMNGIIARHIWLTPFLYIVALMPTPLCLAFLGVEFLRRFMRIPLSQAITS